MNEANTKVAIVGLGYVGLPLAVEFARHGPVVGYDCEVDRIEELSGGLDRTDEVDTAALQEALSSGNLQLTAKTALLGECSVFIVAVPTPVDEYQRPDLTALLQATTIVGQAMPRGSLVVYESTVYPGCTEEVCVPLLASSSGLSQREFAVGYSPERINPGDPVHRLTTIKKITAGPPEVDALYRRIIPAGTHYVPSIRVAEAAKVIENTQRDLNIALMNELAMLFNQLGLDTEEVLAAAGTKWNFLPFRPGLVGGHCIPVDPYYLAHKASEIGFYPDVILAGRRVNEGMSRYIAECVAKRMGLAGKARADVLVLGMTFKENCPDLRNTKVVDLVRELEAYGMYVQVADPFVTSRAAYQAGVTLTRMDHIHLYRFDAVVLAVPHQEFLLEPEKLRALLYDDGLLFDVKSALPAGLADWRL